jgi:hypothetical protein
VLAWLVVGVVREQSVRDGVGHLGGTRQVQEDAEHLRDGGGPQNEEAEQGKVDSERRESDEPERVETFKEQSHMRVELAGRERSQVVGAADKLGTMKKKTRAAPIMIAWTSRNYAARRETSVLVARKKT